MPALRTILCATDFSEPCEAALRLASSLARGDQAALVVLHVLPALSRVPAERGAPAESEAGERRQALRRRLRRVQAIEPGARVEALLREGDPATEILRAAEAIGSGLILLGLHGRTGLEHLLARSVVDEVVRRAACAVLLVRVPGAACG